MAVILDGKKLANKILKNVKEQVSTLGLCPGLAVVVVGEDPASRFYVNNKKKDCLACGIRSEEFALSQNAGEERLLSLIDELNQRNDIHGILVQLPLPDGYSQNKIIQAIAPHKDVDAFHMLNVGRIFNGNYNFRPCTPAGVMELLEAYDIDPQGKDCVVVGHSNIVGKPMAMMLLHKNATVTICHIHTHDLAGHTKRADILVCAVGKINLITKDMVKPGAVVIDVGINPTEHGGITGDVDYEHVREVASYITPVPGGVGPMTRAMLMQNTLAAAIAAE